MDLFVDISSVFFQNESILLEGTDEKWSQFYKNGIQNGKKNPLSDTIDNSYHVNCQ